MARAETIVLASSAALVLLACAVPYGAAPAALNSEAPSAVVETASASAGTRADGGASTAAGPADAADAQSPNPASGDASPPAAPPTCAARTFPEGEYDGVCVDQGADLGPARATLVRGSCASGSVCVPCTVLGKPTGVAGCPGVP